MHQARPAPGGAWPLPHPVQPTTRVAAAGVGSQARAACPLRCPRPGGAARGRGAARRRRARGRGRSRACVEVAAAATSSARLPALPTPRGSSAQARLPVKEPPERRRVRPSHGNSRNATAVAVVWQQRRVWRDAGPLGSGDRPRRGGPAGARGGVWGQGGCAAGPLRRTAAAPLSHPFPSAPAPRLRPGPTPQGQSRPTRTRRLAGQARPRGNGARAARPSHRNSCNATAVAVVLRQRRAWRDPARELHFGP
jgi:hypothetical protein